MTLSFLLLHFSESLATKCLFLIDVPFMVRPTLIDLNPVHLKYYPFMISLDICTGSCNFLFPKMCVPQKWKDVNVKTFNIITNKNETKTMTNHISYDCKCKFNGTNCNSNPKWNKKFFPCECKNYCTCKKDYI